jgi:hypothetical protein
VVHVQEGALRALEQDRPSVFGGLGDIFNPAKFRKMFGDIIKTFDVFKAGGSGKMEDFMENIKKVFLNFFNLMILIHFLNF